jgi:hypothetical protein
MVTQLPCSDIHGCFSVDASLGCVYTPRMLQTDGPLGAILAFVRWLRAYDAGEIPRAAVVEECARQGVDVGAFDKWLADQRRQLAPLRGIQ